MDDCCRGTIQYPPVKVVGRLPGTVKSMGAEKAGV